MNSLHSYCLSSECSSLRFRIVRLLLYLSITLLYFYGLLFSDAALYVTVPKSLLDVNVDVNVKVNNNGNKGSSTSTARTSPDVDRVKFLRSLPHLRVINTIDMYQRHSTKVAEDETVRKAKAKAKSSDEGASSSSSSSSSSPPEKKNTSSTSLSLWKPFCLLLSFILSCRLFLALLIYRNLSQRVELDFSEMGQIRQRRVQVSNSQRPSFWEIFLRTSRIPIRMRGIRGRGNGNSNVNVNSNINANVRARARSMQYARFMMLANRLNEQRVANGAQPMSLQSLALLFSDRDFSGTDYDSLWEVQEQNGPALEELWRQVGASDEEINRCPTRILGEGDELIISTSTSRSTNTGTSAENELNRGGGENEYGRRSGDYLSVDRTKCAICLEHFCVGETIRTIPCFHSFHMDCIDPWLRQKSICPICKNNAVA